MRRSAQKIRLVVLFVLLVITSGYAYYRWMYTITGTFRPRFASSFSIEFLPRNKVMLTLNGAAKSGTYTREGRTIRVYVKGVSDRPTKYMQLSPWRIQVVEREYDQILIRD